MPLDASLGIRINALPGFSVGLSGGYEICKKALFLLPEDLNGEFTGVSRFWGIDANALKAELDLSLRYEIGGFGEGRVSPMEDRRWGGDDFV